MRVRYEIITNDCFFFLCCIQRIHKICQQEINSDDQHKPNVILKNNFSLTTTDFNLKKKTHYF